MPGTPIEYRCILISPADVEKERDALTRTVGLWNAHIGKALNARVNLVRWESHAVPDSLAAPQESLNAQIVSDADFGIAVFWARLGTKTATDQSGSVEEIRRLTERGARVLVYFSDAPVPQALLADDQFYRLKLFREELNRRALAGTFESVEHLCQQVQLHLTSVVSALLPKDQGLPPAPTPILTAPTPDVRVRVNASLVMPENELIPVLQVQVQNHSPVAVYLSNICLMLEDGHRVFAPRDAITGARLYRTELQPGQSFGFFYSPDDVAKASEQSRVICAQATDDIGREYRSDDREMSQVLSQLAKASESRGRRG